MIDMDKVVNDMMCGVVALLTILGCLSVTIAWMWVVSELYQWRERNKKGKGHLVHDGLVLDVNPEKLEHVVSKIHNIPGVRSVTIVEKGNVKT